MASSDTTMPYSFDTNRSYCCRLAQVTLFQIEQERNGHGPQPTPDLASGACTAPPAEPRQVMLDWQVTYFFDRSVDYFKRSVDRLDPALLSVAALAAKLEGRPDVQSRLTPITGYTLSKWLLERELESCCAWTATPDGKTGQMSDAYKAARRRNASGLCLSGGGIRSATFSLGVAQGLSRLGVLGRLSYLSSVSGGGYMHQFLANWIHLTGSTTAVEDLLDPIPRGTGSRSAARYASHRPSHGERASVQAEPLRWLRRYSNYLAPRKGLFTLDTLTIGATWLRNTGLNLLIPVFLFVLRASASAPGTIPYAQFADHPKLVYALVLIAAAMPDFCWVS